MVYNDARGPEPDLTHCLLLWGMVVVACAFSTSMPDLGLLSAVLS